MKEIKINVDSYNSDSINTIQGNNNAEVYKIYVLFNKRRIDLTGKTVKMAYLRTGTVEGDVINLNITNATEGEITLQITNKISKKDGVYSCQLAIYGADGFLEHTATFGLTVEANIFTKIAGEIENSKDFTYIERILEEAKTVSGDLKTNIPVAFNLNTSLESNINNANTVNQTLMATTEQSKVAATEATQKKSELESSLEETKKFIEGLDGSQNIPQIRLDVDELQNGLKNNQSLAYQGYSITCENTIESRTEGMKIGGMSLINVIPKGLKSYKYLVPGFTFEGDTLVIQGSEGYQTLFFKDFLFKPNTKYTVIADIKEINFSQDDWRILMVGEGDGSGKQNSYPQSNPTTHGLYKATFTTPNVPTTTVQMFTRPSSNGKGAKINSIMVLEGDWTDKETPQYFEGLKSLGETEKVEDKYKISILSCDNLINFDKQYKLKPNVDESSDFYSCFLPKNSDFTFRANVKSLDGYTHLEIYDENKNFIDWWGFNVNGENKYINERNRAKDAYYCKIRTTKGNNHDSTIVGLGLFLGNNVETNFGNGYCKKDILISAPLRENDFLYEDNGQVKVFRGAKKYTFTGDEGWSLGSSAGGWSEFEDTLIFYLVPFQTDCDVNTIFLCNRFNYMNNVSINNIGIYNNVWGEKPHPCIRILKSKLTTPDVEGFKAWLKANPTTIVYQLATPVVEVVDGVIDIDLDTYQEKTYFNILNSLPGTLDFKVPSNIGSVVQNMAKEVNNIWDVINNLLVPGILDVNKKVALATIKNNLK